LVSQQYLIDLPSILPEQEGVRFKSWKKGLRLLSS
jgi:hypothetical protein